MICPDYLIEGLEQQFRTIEQQRMEGLPLLNKALRVEAVSFCEWNGLCLGVLITPWFMNLMLIPDEGDTWSDMQIGDNQFHQLQAPTHLFWVKRRASVAIRCVRSFHPCLNSAIRQLPWRLQKRRWMD
ncbi:MAG: [NiFe]-hydrogenase assembly chaperone HybE [Candidatus Thiodiazotropha sp. (ex Lucinoma kastoroae)]|nr:[NiFe]-hydrogenase assembly chaperone HybE [Candidatus Thiodiazotropha sp. (ex Lucinoma kastoroae)]